MPGLPGLVGIYGTPGPRGKPIKRLLLLLLLSLLLISMSTDLWKKFIISYAMKIGEIKRNDSYRYHKYNSEKASHSSGHFTVYFYFHNFHAL